MVAILKDAVLRLRGYVHGSTAERCCTIALMKNGCTEDSGMMYMVALLKDAVPIQRDYVGESLINSCCCRRSSRVRVFMTVL